MKIIFFTFILLFSLSSFAKLEVVRMPINGINPHVSTVTSLSYNSYVIIIKTSNENEDLANECAITYETPGLQRFGNLNNFTKILQQLIQSPQKYLLSCYTEKPDESIDSTTVSLAPTIQLQITNESNDKLSTQSVGSQSISINTIK